MPKITQIEKQGESVRVEIAGLPNHSFRFSLGDLKSKEDFKEQLEWAVKCHPAEEHEELYNEIKKMEGVDIG